jgi:hypothetical protein
VTYLKAEAVPSPTAEERLSRLQDAAGAHLLHLTYLARERAQHRNAPAVVAALDALLVRIGEVEERRVRRRRTISGFIARNLFDGITAARAAAGRSGLALAAEVDRLPLVSAARAQASIAAIRAGWQPNAAAVAAAEAEIDDLLSDPGERLARDGWTAERAIERAAKARAARPAIPMETEPGRMWTLPTECRALDEHERIELLRELVGLRGFTVEEAVRALMADPGISVEEERFAACVDEARALLAAAPAKPACVLPQVVPPATRLMPQAEPWPAPVDFLADDAVTGPPELRPDHLPEALAPFVFDTARRMGVDPAAMALACIVAATGAVSEEWAVQPRMHDSEWTEGVRIWGAIVGSPSVRKTPLLAAATKPLDALDEQARHRHAEELRRWKAEVARLKKEKTADEGLPATPRLDRFLVEGTTVEALTEILRGDDDARQRAPLGKVLIRHDELSGWLADMDRYRAGGRGGGDRAAYLRLFNGGRWVVDRVGRGSFSCPSWAASLLGGVQPEVIQRIARDADDDGLLQRFLFVVPAYQADGEDRAPDHQARERYHALFPALAALRPARGALGRPARVVNGGAKSGQCGGAKPGH